MKNNKEKHINDAKNQIAHIKDVLAGRAEYVPPKKIKLKPGVVYGAPGASAKAMIAKLKKEKSGK